MYSPSPMTTMRPQVHSSEPTTPTPSPMGTTPALSRRERRRQRFFARRLSRLSLEDDDPIERQVLQLLRQARSVHTPTPCSPTLPRLIHLLILMLSLASSAQSYSSHQPFNWTLSDWKSNAVLAFNVTAGAPSFSLHLCSLTGQAPDCYPGCQGQGCYGGGAYAIAGPQGPPISGYYICPSSIASSSTSCHDPAHFFCPSWGCETMAVGWAKPSNKDPNLYLLSRQLSPQRPNVSFLVKDPSADTWLVGRTWGIRLYMTGYDSGAFFTIQKRPPSSRPANIGPNRFLNPPPPTSATPSASPLPSSSSRASSPVSLQLPPTKYSSPLINLIKASYVSLNSSHPNLTRSCWLCLSPSLPLYDPLAIPAPLFISSTDDSPSSCNWDQSTHISLTFTHISSKGICIHPRSSHTPSLTVCANYTSPHISAKYLVPLNTTQWLCSSTGLTPCLSVATLNKTKETCVLILLTPRVIYRTPLHFFEAFDHTQEAIYLHKREPITAVLTVTTLLATAGAATGVAALATQTSALQNLRQAVDSDIIYLRDAVKYLKDSLNSLSEVVLQNRRGLDLLLLKEGGLCAALGEECCVYANYTGLVDSSLKELEKGLNQRRLERAQTAGPWGFLQPLLPYLLPLLTPVLLIILGLTVGPWAIRRIIRLAKDHADSVFSSFVQIHYQRLVASDSIPQSRPHPHPSSHLTSRL
ncbi:nuclear valosin-containing protein-like isoform X11 [Dasypus novemcinctus]